MKRSYRVLKNNFQVALCMFFICSCCWTSSLSQSIKSKHVVHTNKKSQSSLAPLSPDAILSMHDVETDDEDDEDKNDDDYSSNEFGSSGSDHIIGSGSVGGELDEFQKNELPFFLKEPENEFIIKKKPAVLKCITTHAFKVLLFVCFCCSC